MIIIRSAVQKMKSYNPPVENRLGKLRLDFNENTIGPSQKVIKAIKNASAEDYTVYPDYAKIRQKIASLNGLEKENIIVTAGGDEGIRNIMDCFVEEKSEVVIQEPSFAMFTFYAQLRNAKIKKAKLNKDLSFSIKNVIEKINQKTSLVILCNPNNPTGTKIEQKDIIQIIEKSRKTKSLVLVDEAYYDFSKETVIGLVDYYSNLIVLRSFSKGPGLGGLRIGYLAGNKENISSLLKMSSPYSVSSLSIIAAIASIEDLEYSKKYAEEILKTKKFVLKEYKKLEIKTFP